MENVSWTDAQDYVRKLSQKTGKDYRLPSEAEWEYACRAGGAHDYCGGNSVDSVAWYSSNSSNAPHVVADKQPNSWGLFDMSGNVWEWTQDCWSSNYSGAPGEGSPWLSGNCTYRVLRGGSWYAFPNYLRATTRISSSSRNDNYGFRLARSLN